mmetsp:Transcript_19297/g.36450  ORF Transcript_19297/g.36450 Transcript_19297/m.36450 type:complete len:130 (-) Transcript_19297:255-644(-)|eukprot:scaffold9085_cov215-Amphora_coffeaeformis.AAC.5
MDQSARSIFRPRAVPPSYQGPALPKASNHQPCLTPLVRPRQGLASPSGGSTTSTTSSSSASSHHKTSCPLESASFDQENLPTVLFVPEQEHEDGLLGSARTGRQSLSAWSLLAPRFTSRSEFDEFHVSE